MLFRKERNLLTFFVEGRVLIVVVVTLGGLIAMAMGGDLRYLTQWAHGLLEIARLWP
jgi:hypothetical protein